MLFEVDTTAIKALHAALFVYCPEAVVDTGLNRQPCGVSGF